MNTAANPPIEPATSAAANAAAGAVDATSAPSSTTRPWAADTHLPTSLLLNIGHAFDHMFLLIFATAVADDRRGLRVRRAGNR